jgi:hypothetical protein
MHVSFDETNPSKEDNIIVDDDDDIIDMSQKNFQMFNQYHKEMAHQSLKNTMIYRKSGKLIEITQSIKLLVILAKALQHD